MGGGALKLGALNGSLRYSLNDVQLRWSWGGGGGGGGGGSRKAAVHRLRALSYSTFCRVPWERG